jgi:hypothetical protein
MGAGASTPTVVTQPVITLPLERSPISDGASGLHYSGRVYVNDFAASTSGDICKDVAVGTLSVDTIGDVFPGGVSTADLPIDQSTQRIGTTAIQGYVTSLIGKGAIPGELGSFDAQMVADKKFYAQVQAEYCFYEARYKTALAQFLSLISAPTGSDDASVQAILKQTVTINQRLNSLLEIINYVGNDRAQKVNMRSPQIDKANEDIQAKIKVLTEQKNFLQTSDVRENTQREMMRYSEEKNRAMRTQIMFFVALNVVALGTVLTVYKSAGGGGGGA